MKPPSDSFTARCRPDPRARAYVAPSRVLWQSSEPGAVVERPQALLATPAAQIVLGGPAGCVLRHQGAAPGVLLDFGRELHGGVQIGVSDLGPVSGPAKTVRVRVRFGESAAEAMSELGHKGSQTDHAIRDCTCAVPWLGTVELGCTGFRFVRIDLVDPGAFVAIAFVQAVFLYRDLRRLGRFVCSDERLSRIWEVGADTVHFNMQDYVWDGIKRDRLVWIGDMHPETRTIAAVFGGVDVVPASLDLIRDVTPLPGWMNGISSYTMWWVLIQHAWFMHTGDVGYLKQQKPYLLGVLRQLLACIGPHGAEAMPEGRFLDWPSNANPQAIHAGLQALLTLTLLAGARLCSWLPAVRMQRACLDGAARLQSHVPDPNGSKQAAALMALAGLGDPAAINRDVLAVGGANGLSTFYGYYVLQARALAGDIVGCLDAIRQYWGAMLDLGATTFWEDFDLDWAEGAGRIDELPEPGKRDIHGDFGAYCYQGYRHSLCHGWASGPTAWLSEHVLGVRVLEPGCARAAVAPELGDLEWAEGSYPTPNGSISVRHQRRPDGSVRTRMDVPVGVTVVRRDPAREATVPI